MLWRQTSSPPRSGRWLALLRYRPLLQILEARLPPGDTLLSVLAGWQLLRLRAIDRNVPALSTFSPTPFSRSRTVFGDALPGNSVSKWTPEWVVAHPFEEPWTELNALTGSRVPAVRRLGVPAEARAPFATDIVRESIVAPRVPFRPPLFSPTTFVEEDGVPSSPEISAGLPQIPTALAVPNGASAARAAVIAQTPEYSDSLPASFYFEQNVGQADASFDYVARAGGYTVGLSPTEAVFRLSEPRTQRSEPRTQRSGVSGVDREPPPTLRPDLEYRRDNSPVDGHVVDGVDTNPLTGVRGSETHGSEKQIRMQVIGANPAAAAAAVNPQITRVNYFLGNDPNQWRTDIPTFGRIEYDDVYPGIDVAYYATPDRQLEYDFIVAPGADPNQIGLAFTGADSVTLDGEGDLVIQAGDAQIIQPKPVIYQDIAGARHHIEGAFRIGTASCSSTDYCLLATVYFSVGAYDSTRPLIIDPVVLSYSTYLGGPSTDAGYDIAVDRFGAAYVAGRAYSGFPVVNSIQPYGGGGDIFVAKFTPDGQALEYATYIGGKFSDVAYGIALDPSGAAYVSGYTLSGDFPVTPGAFQSLPGNGVNCGGYGFCADSYVTKLSPDGASMVYSTYLGKGGEESADAIAVDAAGNAYVKGQVQIPDWYVVNAVQPVWGGGSCGGAPCFDAFITKLNPTGSGLVYSTYLGGYGEEGKYFGAGGDIAVDPAGQAYITGYTGSGPTFPLYKPYQRVPKTQITVYVTKLSAEGSSFVYSTLLGGSGGQQGLSIAADASGHAYVSGITYSNDFPTTVGAFKERKTAGGTNPDGFVTKFKPDGSALVFSTYFGGREYDAAANIAVDDFGNVSVSGATSSTDFPRANAFQSTFGGGTYDGFVTKLTASGQSLIFSSYLGGGGAGEAGVDSSTGVAVDFNGNVYVTGITYSSTFPTHKPLQRQLGGNLDGFVTKVSRTQEFSFSEKYR